MAGWLGGCLLAVKPPCCPGCLALCAMGGVLGARDAPAATPAAGADDADIVWCATDGLACAARTFGAGEVVEWSFCLPPLLAGALEGCFLLPYCHDCPPAAGEAACAGPMSLKLLPTGWALLFGRCGDANLAVEHGAEPAGPAGAADVRHVLTFRAARRIEAGEVLRTPGPRGGPERPPLFAAALGEAPWWQMLLRPRRPAVEAQLSALHGVGAFAARDLRAGEAVDVVPMLPMPYHQVARTPLRDYVFVGAKDLGGSSQATALLPLGLGGLYNHSSEAPNVYLRPLGGEGDLLQEVVASADVRQGEELLFCYGEGYFTAAWRGREKKCPEALCDPPNVKRMPHVCPSKPL